MLRTGLVSITFRTLSPERIIELVARAGLEGVEWGGDIHVPHGDTARAREVRRWTVDAGLAVPSYGSYYRVGHNEPAPFDAVVETAVALGAPIVRVWAGRQGSADADEAYRDRVVADSQHIADLAQNAGLLVAYEFHSNTLTDTNESTVKLLQQVGHESVVSYWQPMQTASLSRSEGEAYRLAGLRSILPWLSHLHVFHWTDDGGRRPLGEGKAPWRERFQLVRRTGRDHYALIEFVQDDEPEAFLCDAAALKAWSLSVEGEG